MTKKTGNASVLNTEFDKDLLCRYRVYCKNLGYPMNILIEVFMQQTIDGKFHISEESIEKWKDSKAKEKSVLNTTFNKEIYNNFKEYCKDNNYFLKHTIASFMEEIIEDKYKLVFEKKCS